MITSLIIWFAVLSTITLLVLGILGWLRPKWIAAAFPVLALCWFLQLSDLPSKMGYGVDSTLIPVGTEAQVLQMFQSPEAYYVMLLFAGDTEPRMIVFVINEENEESLKNMMKQAQQGPTYIKFGPKQKQQEGGAKGDDTSDGVDSGFSISGFDAAPGTKNSS